MNDKPKLPALPVGGSPLAIVPQTLEETYRLATMIVESGTMPQALAGKEPGKNDSSEVWDRYYRKAKAAVCIVLMSGAELGQTPMVAMRSWTVINGKPALYGEGLINVVRSSPKCKALQTGYIEDAPPEFFLEKGMDKYKVATLKTPEQRSVGWCWAKRSDTGEERFEIFSIANARKAGLWDERTTVNRKKWKTNMQDPDQWEEKPNESPWHRFSERMLMWRSAGFGLRELFADILAGVKDEFEMREIEGEYERIDPPAPMVNPPSPTGSSEDDPSPDDEGGSSSPGGPPSPSATSDGPPSADGEEREPFDHAAFLEQLETGLSSAKSLDELEQVWTDSDVEATCEGDDDTRATAEQMKARLAKRFTRQVPHDDLADLFRPSGEQRYGDHRG